MRELWHVLHDAVAAWHGMVREIAVTARTITRSCRDVYVNHLGKFFVALCPQVCTGIQARMASMGRRLYPTLPAPKCDGDGISGPISRLRAFHALRTFRNVPMTAWPLEGGTFLQGRCAAVGPVHSLRIGTGMYDRLSLKILRSHEAANPLRNKFCCYSLCKLTTQVMA